MPRTDDSAFVCARLIGPVDCSRCLLRDRHDLGKCRVAMEKSAVAVMVVILCSRKPSPRVKFSPDRNRVGQNDPMKSGWMGGASQCDRSRSRSTGGGSALCSQNSSFVFAEFASKRTDGRYSKNEELVRSRSIARPFRFAAAIVCTGGTLGAHCILSLLGLSLPPSYYYSVFYEGPTTPKC